MSITMRHVVYLIGRRASPTIGQYQILLFGNERNGSSHRATGSWTRNFLIASTTPINPLRRHAHPRRHDHKTALGAFLGGVVA